jgi:mRNA-degrading endonuclease RelE of RelBE toxin-antitoxin system
MASQPKMELFMKTIKSLFKSIPSADCQKYLSKAAAIEQSLNSYIDYQKLGGKKLVIAKHLIRFKLGHYRLIFKQTNSGFVLEALIQRKSLNRFLKRR